MLVLISLALKMAVMGSVWGEIVFFKRFFLTEFWLFGCGILAYHAYVLMPVDARPSDYIAFMGLFLIVCVIDIAPDHILPLATFISMPFIFRGGKRFKTDRFIGKVSYPFYLLNFTIIAVFETSFEEPDGWHALLTAIVASICTFAIFNPGIETSKKCCAQGMLPHPANRR